MRTKTLEKSIDALVEKAEDCSELAKAQRASADKQHESAHKLEKLSRAIIEDAAELKQDVDASLKPGGAPTSAK